MTAPSKPDVAMVRRVLDACYRVSGLLGALSMVLLATVVLIQVLGRIVRIQVPGTDDITGWLMAAGACFSLAYAFRHGAHIRVTLLIERLGGVRRRGMEAVCLAVALFTAGLFTWAAFNLVYNSWRFHEVAQGLLPTPLWIPQLVMAFGALFLLIAVLDDLVMLLAGRGPSYQANDLAVPDIVARAAEEV